MSADIALSAWIDVDPTAIGEGTYGIVRKVRCDQIPEKFFAKKVLNDPDLATARREFDAQTRTRCENIVTAYLFYEPAGKPPVIISEFCDNGNLSDQINRPELGPLDPRVIGFYFRQLCNALDDMSQRGLIHRDLKLENIFLDRDFNLKVGDFGMAKALAPGQVTTTLRGSEHYMAPEIEGGQAYTAKADIWSAGIVLAVLIRRTYPFIGPASVANPAYLAFLAPTSPLWAEVTAHMGPQCADLLRGMLAPDHTVRLSIQQVLDHPWVQRFPAPAPEADRVWVKAVMSRRESDRKNGLAPHRHLAQSDPRRPQHPRLVFMGVEGPSAPPALPVLPDEACVTTRFDLVAVPVYELQRRLVAFVRSIGRPVGDRCSWQDAALRVILEISGEQLEVLLRLNVRKDAPRVIVLRADRIQGDGFLFGGPFLDGLCQAVAPWIDAAPAEDGSAA
ncbi:putative Serine/Threonine kinase domain protein [Paratrimastix pyriformis]|uniref:Serine/Threonine kinase domain protein n=1 Tax=Paratrimastix pyriformis TaxID=342808 RepID=A0ABQ8UHK3_9EUKA|nr:putative Serine/Threonine kinase domain protein [Paratrimastix pyriformis]